MKRIESVSLESFQGSGFRPESPLPIAAPMQEKRLTFRLIDHWNNLTRPEGGVPEIKDWRASHLNDTVPFCARIRIKDQDSKAPLCGFEQVGATLQEAFGKESMVGKLVRPTTPVFPAARIIRRIPELITGCAPIEDDGQFVNESGKVVKYRSALLPFADHKGIVEVTIIGFNWRIF